jgi:hypothetical protein
MWLLVLKTHDGWTGIVFRDVHMRTGVVAKQYLYHKLCIETF